MVMRVMMIIMSVRKIIMLIMIIDLKRLIISLKIVYFRSSALVLWHMSWSFKP